MYCVLGTSTHCWTVCTHYWIRMLLMQMFREKWRQGNFPGWRGKGGREGIVLLVVVREGSL